MANTSTGLSTLEPLTLRVQGWRHRIRAQSSRIDHFDVTYDGRTIASLTARTAATLDEELASAAWELAQSIERPVTVEIRAMPLEGDEEIASFQMRVHPSPATAQAPANNGEAKDVIRILVDANQAQQKMILDVVSAFTVHMRDAMQMMSDLAQQAHTRARTLETEVAIATETARDAIGVARDSAEPRRSLTDRGLDLVEGVLREALTGKSANSPANDTPAATAPQEAPAAAPAHDEAAE